LSKLLPQGLLRKLLLQTLLCKLQAAAEPMANTGLSRLYALSDQQATLPSPKNLVRSRVMLVLPAPLARIPHELVSALD